MRLAPSWFLLLAGGVLLGTAGCDRPANTDDRRTPQEKTDQAAHQAGEEAYKLTQKTKEVTQDAVEKLKKTGREVRDGWEDAKHTDPDRNAPHPQR